MFRPPPPPGQLTMAARFWAGVATLYRHEGKGGVEPRKRRSSTDKGQSSMMVG